MKKLMIYFSDKQKKVTVTYDLKLLIRRTIAATLAFEGFSHDCEISVTFCDNRYIRSLNRQYRKIDKPTDVLSFPMFGREEIEGGDFGGEVEVTLGDIVLSLEKAREQARKFGHGFEREAAFLTAHSVLHLLGYDHENSPDEENTMRAKQRALMKTLGLELKNDSVKTAEEEKTEQATATATNKEKIEK